MLKVPLDDFNEEQPMQIIITNPSGENPVISVVTQPAPETTEDSSGILTMLTYLIYPVSNIH